MLYTYLLTLFILVTIIAASFVEKSVDCPFFCECDIYQNLNRATCRGTNWVTVEAGIPPQVNILDMSQNHINKLDDHIFEELKLTSLELLNLSNNALQEIHMNAFLGLLHIKTIDLSNNRLRYVLINWFWDLEGLLEVYLNNNHLGRIGEDPLLESKTMKVLSVAYCFIPAFYPDTFTKLPNLEVLDVSGNPLLQLNPSVIKPTPHLNTLLTNDIEFDCNEMMKTINNYCQTNGIRYKDPCFVPQNDGVEKFQKMVVEESSRPPKNTWLFNERDHNDSITENNTTCITSKKSNFLNEIILVSPILSILLPFFFGISVGILLGFCMFAKKTTQKDRRKVRTRARRGNSIIRVRNTADQFSLLDHITEMPESTPMTPRKLYPINSFQ